MLVGEGRRLKAITLFPSMPNISLFVFRQSQQFGLSFSALKLRFSKIHQHSAKDVTFKKFYKFITDQWIMCSVDKLLYNFKADITSLYALWAQEAYCLGYFIIKIFISFAWRGRIFENRKFNALNLPFNNVIIAGKLKFCGMEDRTVVAYGCRKKT